MSEASIPSISFDLSALATEERWETWRSYNAGLFDVEIRGTDEGGISASTDTFVMGDLVLGKNKHSATYYKRDESKARQGGEEQLVLLLNETGASNNLMGDRPVTNSTEVFTLYDLNQAIEIESEATEYIYAVIPYASIGYDPSIHGNAIQTLANSSTGRLLKSNAELLFSLTSEMSAIEAATVGEIFLEFLKALVHKDLRNQSVRESFASAREVALHRYIRENAQNPALTPDDACKSLGLSRATLYRMMDELGGFHNTVKKVRLSGARKDLASLPRRNGAIAKVSSKWGFYDPAHFSRLFKDEFGLKPSDVLGERLEPENGATTNGVRPDGEMRSIRQLSQLLQLAG